VIGGCLSIGLAIRQFAIGGTHENQTVSWVVLAIAFFADGISWFQSIGQARQEAKVQKRSIAKHLRLSSDPILRAIVVEDSAALVGTAIAAGGLLFSQLTGSSTPDAVASLLIGILLAFTAVGLARPLAEFLVGRSLPKPMLNQIHELMIASPSIEEVVGVQAVYIGPQEVIVIAKIRPSCATVAELTQAMDDLDHRIREAVPLVADVFVDVTTLRVDDGADLSA
jgi:divalent metal cation (Fe/Co/Zn/Cd) transporter